MNRYDRYTGIKWDVPMYIPNYDKLTSIAEEQGKYYKGVQDDYDAITNAAKTASAQVKYINDLSLGDPEVYKNWLNNLQTQQNEISKAYQQDYRLGMQKLKEFQQGLHQDLTAGTGYKLHSRYTDYNTQLANLQEAKAKGIYKDNPEFADYFMQGEGRKQWATTYDQGKIGIPKLQGYWNDQDEQQLVQNMKDLKPDERSLMEALKDDPQALAEIKRYKENYKSVNGSMPFYQLMVDGSISQVTKARLFKYAQSLIEPKANEINFTYKVKSGLDGVVNSDVSEINPDGTLSNPKATYINVPVLDEKGQPKIDNNGEIVYKTELNNNNPLVKHLMGLAEGMAYRNPTFKAEQVKNVIAEEQWKWGFNRRKEIEDAKFTPVITSEGYVKNPNTPVITRQDLTNRIELYRKSFDLPRGNEIPTINQRIQELVKKQNPSQADIAQIAQLNQAKEQIQNSYAIAAKAGEATNTPSYNEFVATNIPQTIKGYKVGYDKTNGKPYIIDAKGNKKYAPSQDTSPVSDYGDATWSVEDKVFAELNQAIGKAGKTYSDKIDEGLRIIHSQEMPSLTFTNVNPIQQAGIEITQKQLDEIDNATARALMSYVASKPTELYALTNEGDGKSLVPSAVPTAAQDVTIDPKSITYSYNGLLNQFGDSEYMIGAKVSYKIPNGKGGFITATKDMAIPQSRVDNSTGNPVENFDVQFPEVGVSYSQIKHNPAVVAANKIRAAQSYPNKGTYEVVSTYDNSLTVYKQNGKFYVQDSKTTTELDPKKASTYAAQVLAYNNRYLIDPHAATLTSE